MLQTSQLSPSQLFALTQLSIHEKEIADAVKSEWEKRNCSEQLIQQLSQSYQATRASTEKLTSKDTLIIVLWPLLAFIISVRNKKYYTLIQWRQFWKFTAWSYLIRLILLLLYSHFILRP